MYGTIGYERARAIKLVEDLADCGLKQGGEQYPNALCAIDCAENLNRAVDKTPGLPQAEADTCRALAAALERVWTEGYEPDRGRGVTQAELTAVAEAALAATPPVFPHR